LINIVQRITLLWFVDYWIPHWPGVGAVCEVYRDMVRSSSKSVGIASRS